MKITIIGAGAMGSLFGSLLAQSGHEVLLVDVWQEHVDSVNAQGLGVESDGKTRRVDIKASINVDDGQNSDLVIIFVKSTQTEKVAADAVRCLDGNGFVLTLQNGMGNADIISQVVDPDRVIAGTTSHGATVLGPGLIRHAGVGQTMIGMWSRTSSADLAAIKKIFNNAGIETSLADDIHLIVWEKLIVNVGINAITALTGIKNGKIVDGPPTGELVRTAVGEACDVALAYGVVLPDYIADRVFAIAKATGPNRSSMGQDIDHKRQTEIDAINGAVVRLAKPKNIEVPVNLTLTALVKTLQKNYE